MKESHPAKPHFEKQDHNPSFQLFQPMQVASQGMGFWAQQNELSEVMLKNSIKSQSFRLQPSIINISAFKEVEKPNISDFSTHLGPLSKSRRNSAPKNAEVDNEKGQAAKIRNFDLVRAEKKPVKVEGAVGKVASTETEMSAEVKRQLQTYQFDSEAEDILEYDSAPRGQATYLCFIDKEHISIINKRISKTSKRVVDLTSFLKARDTDTRDVKTYACKYCPKVFVKRAALGGHTAKNHPHQSDSYRIRQESLMSRKIERERFDYFKTIEHK